MLSKRWRIGPAECSKTALVDEHTRTHVHIRPQRGRRGVLEGGGASSKSTYLHCTRAWIVFGYTRALKMKRNTATRGSGEWESVATSRQASGRIEPWCRCTKLTNYHTFSSSQSGPGLEKINPHKLMLWSATWMATRKPTIFRTFLTSDISRAGCTEFTWYQRIFISP